jgi:hypothetical protein
MTDYRPIFEVALNFFNQDNWPFSQSEDEPILNLVFQGTNGEWVCYAKAREEENQFVFYSNCQVNVPANKRQAMAEFLTRANHGLVIGNFEMDFEEGLIRYKTSIDVESDRLTPALVKQVVYANVITMDKYLPGIMKVIYGDVSPKEAISKIEE